MFTSVPLFKCDNCDLQIQGFRGETDAVCPNCHIEMKPIGIRRMRAKSTH